jgi:hypothetical protein
MNEREFFTQAMLAAISTLRFGPEHLENLDSAKLHPADPKELAEWVSEVAGECLEKWLTMTEASQESDNDYEADNVDIVLSTVDRCQSFDLPERPDHATAQR